jgi:hypothetical protein
MVVGGHATASRLAHPRRRAAAMLLGRSPQRVRTRSVEVGERGRSTMSIKPDSPSRLTLA